MILETVLISNVAAGSALGKYLGELVARDMTGNEDWAGRVGLVRGHLAVSEAMLRAGMAETDPERQRQLVANAREVAEEARRVLEQAPEHSDGVLSRALRDARGAVLRFASAAANVAANAAKGVGVALGLLGLGFLAVVLVVKGSK